MQGDGWEQKWNIQFLGHILIDRLLAFHLCFMSSHKLECDPIGFMWARRTLSRFLCLWMDDLMKENCPVPGNYMAAQNSREREVFKPLYFKSLCESILGYTPSNTDIYNWILSTRQKFGKRRRTLFTFAHDSSSSI